VIKPEGVDAGENNLRAPSSSWGYAKVPPKSDQEGTAWSSATPHADSSCCQLRIGIAKKLTAHVEPELSVDLNRIAVIGGVTSVGLA
jgi:hypothetical protein